MFMLNSEPPGGKVCAYIQPFDKKLTKIFVFFNVIFSLQLLLMQKGTFNETANCYSTRLQNNTFFLLFLVILEKQISNFFFLVYGPMVCTFKHLICLNNHTLHIPSLK